MHRTHTPLVVVRPDAHAHLLDLVPVVQALADAHGLHATWVRDEGEDPLASRSDWVLLSRDGKILDRPRIAEAATEIVRRPEWRLWTDDFNNLVQVLKP